MFSFENSLGYVFDKGKEHFDPTTCPTELDLIRHFMFVFDDAVANVKGKSLIPKIKSTVIAEVSKDVMAVWNGLNLPI